MDVTNATFLFYGYSAAWLIVFGFIVILLRRGRRIDNELGRLKSLVDDRGKS